MYLNFENICKQYGPVTAVENVTFGVKQGEFVSLLGPSGCGKTTTLMMLAGFETPNAGRIELDGKDLAGMPPEKRGVGVVFQHYALFPHMCVADNIAFGLTHGARAALPKAQVAERVAELLDMIDLAPLAKRKPAELSAGQQQRVAIARSLAPHPRVLCLDEPLSALDAILREKLRLEIRRLQRDLQLTVLYVTHDQEEALAVSDRVVVMTAGRVAQAGTPWDIYDRPSNGYVAGFIGKGSLLYGLVTSVGSNMHLTLSDGNAVTLPIDAWCGTEPPQPNTAVTMVVRAERAWAIDAEECAPSGLLRFPGRLLDVEFLGGALRLHIVGSAGQLTVLAPAVDYAVWRHRTRADVCVICRPEDVRITPQ